MMHALSITNPTAAPSSSSSMEINAFAFALPPAFTTSAKRTELAIFEYADPRPYSELMGSGGAKSCHRATRLWIAASQAVLAIADFRIARLTPPFRLMVTWLMLTMARLFKAAILFIAAARSPATAHLRLAAHCKRLLRA